MSGGCLGSWNQKGIKKSRMPHLTDKEWSFAARTMQAHMNQPEIARHLGSSGATISKLRRYLEDTGSVSDHPRPGRPRVTTANRTDGL